MGHSDSKVDYVDRYNAERRPVILYDIQVDWEAPIRDEVKLLSNLCISKNTVLLMRSRCAGRVLNKQTAIRAGVKVRKGCETGSKQVWRW